MCMVFILLRILAFAQYVTQIVQLLKFFDLLYILHNMKLQM